MTLLRQIQNLLERTYAPAGVNLEECLIGKGRFQELSERSGDLSRQLSQNGRTFLRISNGNLHLAIYYHPGVISVLEEHYPLNELSHENILQLIVFLEELNHALHAALLFREQRLDIENEEVLCNLELQAKVDTYLTLKLIITVLRKKNNVPVRHERWIRKILFRQEKFSYQEKVLEIRYREANRLGLKMIRYLDRLDASQRVEVIRKFRFLPFIEKKNYIASLGR